MIEIVLVDEYDFGTVFAWVIRSMTISKMSTLPGHPTQPGQVYCTLEIDHISLVDYKWIASMPFGHLDITCGLLCRQK